MTLYEQDFQHWLTQHIEWLKTKQFQALDVDNLIDALESMAKRDKHELISHLIILLAHLLKWQFQASHRSASWESSIAEQRVQIEQQLECSPSLNGYFSEVLSKAYPKAIKLAAREARLPAVTFPINCPYLIEELLNEDFYPHAKETP